MLNITIGLKIGLLRGVVHAKGPMATSLRFPHKAVSLYSKSEMERNNRGGLGGRRQGSLFKQLLNPNSTVRHTQGTKSPELSNQVLGNHHHLRTFYIASIL